jgi:hypothetical protein
MAKTLDGFTDNLNAILELVRAEKWNGVYPLYFGGPANALLSLK